MLPFFAQNRGEKERSPDTLKGDPYCSQEQPLFSLILTEWLKVALGGGYETQNKAI